MKQIILTNNFKKDFDGVIGKIEFAPTANAKALYELLKENPEWFSFEIGYIKKEDGTKELTEISLVSKHTKT